MKYVTDVAVANKQPAGDKAGRERKCPNQTEGGSGFRRLVCFILVLYGLVYMVSSSHRFRRTVFSTHDRERTESVYESCQSVYRYVHLLISILVFQTDTRSFLGRAIRHANDYAVLFVSLDLSPSKPTVLLDWFFSSSSGSSSTNGSPNQPSEPSCLNGSKKTSGCAPRSGRRSRASRRSLKGRGFRTVRPGLSNVAGFHTYSC